MIKRIKIGDKWIGEGEPCFLVAEISCNHLQKKEYALKLIEEAKNAGADAVKFQTYLPNTITIDSDKEYFRIKDSIWKGRTLYSLYEEAYTPWDWFPELKDKAKEEGLIFFSTPFDKSAVDFLEKLKLPAYKIASFEINDIPLLKYVAKTKKPIILSTGLASLEDIKLAVSTIKKEGNKEIVILKCTSAYPAPVKEANLRTMQDIRERFDVLTGLSDHSLSLSLPTAAVVMGASIIEKHFMLDKKLGGPDAEFSLEPHQFKEIVKAVREAEQSIGEVDYKLSEKSKEHKFFMRSIFIVRDIGKGEKFTEENIRVIRPSDGLHPKYYEGIIGKKAKKDLERGTPLDLEMVE